MSLMIRKAKVNDLEPLVDLINSAYRTESARTWTTEKSFVAGDRITKAQLDTLLQQVGFELFVGEIGQNQIVACIGLTLDLDNLEISTFAISPSVQNLGYGSEMLSFAETYVAHTYSTISEVVMYVLDVRIELIAYYQRRGYQMTGQLVPYPIGAEVGQPLVEIQLVEMKKYL